MKGLKSFVNYLDIKFITGEKIISANSNSVKTAKNNEYFFDYFINSCGGYSLEVAKIFDINTDYKLLPFKVSHWCYTVMFYFTNANLSIFSLFAWII